MATLHLVFNSAGFAACAGLISAGDCVLLLDAAALGAVSPPTLPRAVRLCSIVGSSGHNKGSQRDIVSYDDFVALAASHERVVSWD